MDARRARFLPLLALAASFVGACGGAGASFESGVFRAPGVVFHVGDVPSAWHRVDVEEGVLAFRDDHGSSVLVSGRCNLRADDIPIVALANQLVMGTTDREIVKEEVVSFDRREARHVVMRAKLDGVPLVWDLYVMKKDGCVYDLVFVAPPDRFDAGSGTFEQFANAFHTVSEKS